MSEQQPGNPAGPAVGATLGKYRLEQAVEQRAPVFLFLAREQATQQRVRLWTLALPNLVPEDRIIYLGHFQQEAGQLLTLQHPNLLPLSDYGIARDIPYLVAPYFSARPMNAHLREKGQLDLLQASRYLDQLANALEYAHQQGIWHLNLTTDCLLLQENDRLVITETGIARILATGAKLASAHPQTHSQETFPVLRDSQGRALYGLGESSAPAPELLSGSTVDAAADVYSLGAVLYRMLTGHRVFRGNTPQELINQHLNTPPPALSGRRPGLSPELDKLLATALAKNRAQRFQRPVVLANAYHQIVAPQDTGRPFIVQSVAPQISPLSEPAHARTIPVPSRTPYTHQPASSGKATVINRRRLVTLIVAGTGVAAAVTVVTLFAMRPAAGNNPTAVANTGRNGNNGGTSATQTGGSGNPGSNSNVLAHTSDLPTNSAKQFPLSGSNNPGLLIHLADNRFVAFDSTCTHAGCAVAYSSADKLLTCPCHSAVFDPARNASVVQGPATTPLKAIPITVQSDGSITTEG